MSQQQQQRHFTSTPFFVKASSRPKFQSNRRRFCTPYQPRDSTAPVFVGQEFDDGMNVVERPSRNCTLGRESSISEGLLEVAAEVEVKVVEAEGTEEGTHANSNPQIPQQRQQQKLLPATSNGSSHHQRHLGAVSSVSSVTIDEQPSAGISRHFLRRSLRTNSGTPSISSIQQLLRFDSNQCFDIEEFRVRMAAAQQKIEDLCSLNLNNVKLKHENGQLREDLDSCERRISLLESSVLERNERLKELLRENVFMRAQFKKIQNEFGVQAVKEVFDRR
uniref:Uncharacterized protein n=1 Tax=Globodera rostochiensis TaxID=31243 RepID=A0A914HN74_GLORO